MRGGYQVTFRRRRQARSTSSNFIFSNPGFTNLAQTAGPTDGSYFNTANLPGLIPIPPNSLPMQPIPLLKQNQDGNAFDSELCDALHSEFHAFGYARYLSRT